MLCLRRVLRCGRNYHVRLPATWCRHHAVRSADPIPLSVYLDGGFHPHTARAVAHARGLCVALPRPWRQAEGLTWGDPLFLFEIEPGLLALQRAEGASAKELDRLCQVVAQQRIAAARADVQRAREAGYREGFARGWAQGAFHPAWPPMGTPPRGRRGRG